MRKMEKRQETSKTHYSGGPPASSSNPLTSLAPVPPHPNCAWGQGDTGCQAGGLHEPHVHLSLSWGNGHHWQRPGLSVISWAWSWPAALAHTDSHAGGLALRSWLSGPAVSRPLPFIPHQSWLSYLVRFTEWNSLHSSSSWATLACSGRDKLAPQTPWRVQSIGSKMRKHSFKWDNHPMTQYSTTRPLSEEIFRMWTQSFTLLLVYTRKGVETDFPVPDPVSATYAVDDCRPVT